MPDTASDQIRFGVVGGNTTVLYLNSNDVVTDATGASNDVVSATVESFREAPTEPPAPPVNHFGEAWNALSARAIDRRWRARQEISSLEASLCRQRRLSERYENTPTDSTPVREQDWALMAVEGTTVPVVTGDELWFDTGEIFIGDSKVSMGRYHVRVCLDSGSVHVLDLEGNTSLPSYHGGPVIHPHVGPGGTACLGKLEDGEDLQDLISERLADFDVPAVVRLVVRFLRSYDSENPYVRMRQWDGDWPEDGEWCSTCERSEDDCDCRWCEGCESSGPPDELSSCGLCDTCCSEIHTACDRCGDHESSESVCSADYCRSCCEDRHTHCSECNEHMDLCDDGMCSSCCTVPHCTSCGVALEEGSDALDCEDCRPPADEEEGGEASDTSEPAGVGQDEGARESP